MARTNYHQALQGAQTVAECQTLYEAELANKAQEYQDKYPENYRALVAAHEVDYWIAAENRAQALKGSGHSYGNLIHRRYTRTGE